MHPKFRVSVNGLTTILVLLGISALPIFGGPLNFSQHNLVSDIPGLAAVTDADLVNPWGLSSSAGSPWWVSDAGKGKATIYNGNTGVKAGLIVTIPPAGSSPTGQVFNSTGSFAIGGGSNAVFIFATENGTIAAWNGAQGTNAFLEVDNSAAGAIYKGLALGSVGSNNFLYAANFHSGKIDVFDGNFVATTLPGGFVDPTLPAGYAPFNIRNLGGKLYVAYAKQDAAKEDEEAGPGFGYVDVFDTNGVLLQRLASNGPLNAPWGLAIAPSNFGAFGNDLLVGNFGDGTINVFDSTTPNMFLGTLLDVHGAPINIEGLWSLAFGNGANAGPKTSLFFTAGISHEDHGLFGNLTPTPEPSAVWMTLFGGVSVLLRARRRKAGPVR